VNAKRVHQLQKTAVGAGHLSQSVLLLLGLHASHVNLMTQGRGRQSGAKGSSGAATPGAAFARVRAGRVPL